MCILKWIFKSFTYNNNLIQLILQNIDYNSIYWYFISLNLANCQSNLRVQIIISTSRYPQFTQVWSSFLKIMTWGYNLRPRTQEINIHTVLLRLPLKKKSHGRPVVMPSLCIYILLLCAIYLNVNRS